MYPGNSYANLDAKLGLTGKSNSINLVWGSLNSVLKSDKRLLCFSASVAKPANRQAGLNATESQKH